jgi:hypothetical protein
MVPIDEDKVTLSVEIHTPAINAVRPAMQEAVFDFVSGPPGLGAVEVLLKLYYRWGCYNVISRG